jgi:hypothetical protein
MKKRAEFKELRPRESNLVKAILRDIVKLSNQGRVA